MYHRANLGFLALAERGFVTCGSVMVPCPWFHEIAEAAAADPALDLGVHLALTTEWEHYRWAPLSTVSPASRLIDDEGYFWRDVANLSRNLVPEAAEVEVRAQIERARSAEIKPNATVAGLERDGLPVVDHIRGPLPVAAEAVEPGYRRVVEELLAGVTHFALHCTVSGDVEAITPQYAPWRTNEYALLASGTVAEWCTARGVVPIGYREIQRLRVEVR